MEQATCDHCLLPVPECAAVRDRIDGTEHLFCCAGCRGVYLLIREEGLADFYRKRAWDTPGKPARDDQHPDARSFSGDIRRVGGEDEIDLLIDGIRCASCIWLNERILRRTPGVSAARISFATHKARIRWNPQLTDLGRILERIHAIGYDPRPYRESERFRSQQAEMRDLLVRFGTAAFLSSQLMIYSIALYAGYFQGIDPELRTTLEYIAMFLTLPVIFYAGMPFIRNTISGLRHMRFTMDSLITIGAGSAFIYSLYEMHRGGTVYFDTAAMIITLILLGRYIEATAKGKASETIRRLMELTPPEAQVIAGHGTGDLLSGSTEKLPVADLRQGTLVKVIPGERIPADGTVVCGSSEVNESLITGESRPAEKTTGSSVIGGSMNLYGSFIFRVTKTGKDTVLSGIISAVEDAQANKPRLQVLADRIVGYFVPAILLTALLTAAAYILIGAPPERAIMTAIAVLVIACPCSLGLATPLAVLIFTGTSSSHGILVRSGEMIENMSKTTHVIFDKTGTLTAGRPALRETILLEDTLEPDEAITLAASVERHAEHSIGRAIVDAAGGRLRPSSGFRAVPGRGVVADVDGIEVAVGNRAFMAEQGINGQVRLAPLDATLRSAEGQGDTAVFAGWNGRMKAIFIVADCLRAEAVDAVSELQRAGLTVSIVSGDNQTTTEAIAAAVGVSSASAEMVPAGKQAIIRALQQDGAGVLMVGDGINDAPALTEARVGIAVGRGTDIAMESADAVLMRDDLRLVPYAVRLSQRAYRIIRQNIFWAFFYNLIALPLAVYGALHPIIAAGAMAGSSLFVVLNSLRIRKEASV